MCDTFQRKQWFQKGNFSKYSYQISLRKSIFYLICFILSRFSVAKGAYMHHEILIFFTVRNISQISGIQLQFDF